MERNGTGSGTARRARFATVKGLVLGLLSPLLAIQLCLLVGDVVSGPFTMDRFPAVALGVSVLLLVFGVWVYRKTRSRAFLWGIGSALVIVVLVLLLATAGAGP